MLSTPVYVLHYKGNGDRRTNLQRAFAAAGIQATWITQCDAGEFDLQSTYQFEPDVFRRMVEPIKELMVGYSLGLRPEMSNIPWIRCVELLNRQSLTLRQLEERAPWLAPSSRSVAEVSLFLKHRAAWQSIADGDREFGLVAEDDIIFGPQSTQYLADLLRQLPADADYIDIAGGCNLRPRLGNAVVNLYFFDMRPPRDRTTCCALVSRRLAQELVRLAPPIALPVDWTLTWVFNRLGSRVYWVDPPVFGHGSEMRLYRSSIR